MPAQPRRQTLFLATGTLATAAICGYHTYLVWDFQLDDALIYSRYVANALDGHGLVYNIGERVNGFTSPLYVGLSLLAAYLGPDVPTSQIALGALGLFLTAALTMLVFAWSGRAAYGVAAALLIVSSRFFYVTFGMETTLFLFLISSAIACYLTDRDLLLGVAGGLLVAMRGEGLILVLMLVVAYHRKRRRWPPLRALALLVAIGVSPYLFLLAYYGQLAPSTLGAKIAQGRSGLWGERFAFFNVAFLFTSFLGKSVSTLGLSALLAACALARWRREPYATLLLGYVLLYSALYGWLNIPNYHWYYAIHVYTLEVLMAAGLMVIHDGVSAMVPAHPRWRWMPAGVAGLVLAAVLALHLAHAERSLRRIGAEHRSHERAIGTWLARHTPADASVACVEIGHIGWHSKRYIIDIMGLVSPHNAELIAARDFTGWTRLYRPDYILVHSPIWPLEQAAVPLFQRRAYLPVADFPHEGYVLLRKVGGVDARKP